MTDRVRRLAHWGATAAALTLVVALASTVEWSETWRAVRAASPMLLVAAGVANLASLATRATRWWIFLRAAGAPSYGAALRGAVVGSGLNNLLPANGGEAARVLLVSRRAGVSSATVLATVALDRLVEFLSCVALLAVAPLVAPLPAALARWRAPGAVALAGLALVVGVLARRAALVAHAPMVPAGVLEEVLPATRSRVRAYLARFAAAMTGLPTPRRLAPALLLSLVSWSGQAAVYHLTARALGLPVGVAASTAAMLAVNLSFLVQLTPGNVGIFQVLYALVMAAYGVSHHAAIGAAVVIQTLQIVPVTALALVLAPAMVLHRAR
jgi:uncharacterized protein (TIRG00374 family)